jgi:4-hydroxy-2-oxoglutarate aldolase
MLIEGILAAVPTPFYPDERVYFRKLEANVARYSRSLLSGMLLLGSTGEAVALDDAESRDVLRVAAEAAAPDKVLIAGVGRESVKATVELAEAAAQFLRCRPGPHAHLLREPDVLGRRSALLSQRGRPLAAARLLYNIPRCVPYDIPIELIAELAQHPNIIGIKDSSGNLPRIGASVEATRNAARRTVTVTPIFEAVTARMLAAKSEATAVPLSPPATWQGAWPWQPLRPRLPSRRGPKRSASRCSPARRPSCLKLLKPARPEPSWDSPPALHRPARRSTLPGRITI